MKIGLTEKQRKYKRNRLKGMTKYASAINAGYSHYVAAKRVKPDIEDRIGFDAILQRHGLTPDEDAKDLARLRKAKITKFFQHEGEITDQCDVEDNGTQLDALRLTLELKGKLKESPLVDQSEHNTLIFEVVNINQPVDQSI